MVLIAYKFHQSMIDALTGSREVTRREEPQLYNLLENLCISRGITMPKLKVMEDDALNLRRHRAQRQAILDHVTSGLLRRLDDAELEAVLAHELTHIRNGDVRMLVIAVVIAGVVSFFAELVFRLMFQDGFRWRSGSSGGDRKGSGGAAIAIIIAVVMIAIAWLLSIVIRFALSRKREYLADAGSVELTQSRRHDHGAAQDRGPRRARRRDLRGDGNVRRQSALGLRRPVRHPPADRAPHRLQS